jgi:hypothetical protein
MIRYVLASCLFLFSLNLISCSDQKAQLPKGQGVPNPVVNTSAQEEGVSFSEQDDRIYIPGNVTGRDPNTGFDPREGLDNERDNLTEVNSKQPIIFDGQNPNNSGLAGINFKTTLDDAALILSHPVEYDCGFYYEEGMCIEWQKDGAQRPKQMIIVQNYLGEIELPAPIGKIRMGTDLKRYFQANDPVGKSVVEMLYRSFFKVADPNYSCIQDGKCEAREVETAIIWRLPNIFLQLSKDGGNQLFLILLENKFDSGILTSDFDLLNNSFSEGSNTVQLGQSWGDVKTLGEVQDVESVIQTTNFRKDYDGVNAWVYRPDAFNSPSTTVSATTTSSSPLTPSFVAPIEAQDKDIFGGVSLFGSYPGKFKINGEYIKVNLQGDVKLSADPAETASEFSLKTQLPWLADNYNLQVKILKNLEIELSKSLTAKLGSNIKTSVRFDGLESRPSANKWINFTIYYFAEKTPTEFEAGFIFVGMSVRNGYLQVLKEISFDPFIKTTSDSFSQEISLALPVVPTVSAALANPAGVAAALPVDQVTSLQGFNIGEEVELNRIDWLRSEANFIRNGESVRVSFEPRSYIRVSYLDNETEILNVWSVSGISRMSLGLKPLDASPYGKSSIKFKISAVTSHLNPVGIRGLCGFDTLVVRDSSYYTIRTGLIDDIKNQKSNCAFFGRGNNAEDGEYDQMFFPNQKIKLIFTEKLFTGVTIYE